jgi:hypothetical protein
MIRIIAWAVLLLLALSPAGIAASDGFKKVGSWTVHTLEPDPGRLVTSLTVHESPYSINLYCVGGRWSVFISKYSARDTRNSLTQVELYYSIDGGPSMPLRGTGHPSYRFDLDRGADDFVRSLISAKSTLAFVIRPAKSIKIIPLQGTADAVSPFLERCPL